MKRTDKKATFGQQATKVTQLADTLSQAISRKEFLEGDSLPSINQLSAQYGVSRDTVFKAFLDLRERGLIDSTPGKGYYVTSQVTNVLLLLDQYTPFKEALYNSFVRHLPINYKVDLLFHQYNERLFNTILRESIGKYNKYIVMNFDNEKFSSNLYKIEPSKLLLLDFGKFDKKEYSYVCQDFDDGFYQALNCLEKQLGKYERLILLLPSESKHPGSSGRYFIKFCREKQLKGEIIDNTDEINIKKGEAYIVIRQIDVVNIIKKSRAEGLKCGSDFGVLAYNDTPSYEVIDQGITSISIDWEQMGKLAADFVLSGKEIKEYLPTEVHIRHSL